MSRLDLTCLVGGLALLAVGLFLLLDSTGSVHLTAGWTASMILAAVGGTLVASGLGDGRHGRR